MSDSIEKIKKNRRRTLLKKELLAAGIAALVSLPGKGEAKTASAPEARMVYQMLITMMGTLNMTAGCPAD